MTSHISLHICFIAAIVASYVHILTTGPAQPTALAIYGAHASSVCRNTQLYALECRIQAATDRLEHQIMRKLLTCGDGSCADFELTANMLALSWLNELDRTERKLMHDKLSKEEKRCMSDGFQQLKTFLGYKMDRIEYLTKTIAHMESTTKRLRTLNNTDTRTMDFVFHMAYKICNCVLLCCVVILVFAIACMMEGSATAWLHVCQRMHNGLI
jgi:hypothetical protein